MRPTPKRAGRSPRKGSRFLSDVVAENVRVLRTLRRLSQSDLAARMSYLGHEWTRATVSDVERSRRNVTVDELLGLALSLRTEVPNLLDPAGIDGRAQEALDYGIADPIPTRSAQDWLHGRVGYGLLAEGPAVVAGSLQIWRVDGHDDAFKAAVDSANQIGEGTIQLFREAN